MELKEKFAHRAVPAMELAIGAVCIWAFALAFHNGYKGQDNSADIPTQQLVSAIHVANQAQPGSVLQVESLHEDGRVIVDVDILAANGQRYDVTVEAHTSKVLSIKKDFEATKMDGKYRPIPRSGW